VDPTQTGTDGGSPGTDGGTDGGTGGPPVSNGCGCRGGANEVGAGSEAFMAALLMLGFASRGARRRRQRVER